jgi:hypothetical protein
MTVMQTGQKEGMTLLNMELTRLVKQEVIEPRHAYDKAVDRNDLMRQFQAANIRFNPQGEKSPTPAPEPVAAE